MFWSWRRCGVLVLWCGQVRRQGRAHTEKRCESALEESIIVVFHRQRTQAA